MAPITGSSHSFQKLKLDTSTPHKPLASTFDSIPRHEPHQDGVPPSQLDADRADANGHCSHALCQDGAYAQAIPIKRESNGAIDRIYDGGSTAVSSGSSEEDDLEAQFRRRTKSISFNNEVILDSGNRITMDDPLPKPRLRRSRPDTPDGEHSDQEFLEMSVAQRKSLHHQVGEPRYPLLQTTVDELATDPDGYQAAANHRSFQEEFHDQVASLTSAATASPLEEARTPLETPTEYLLSPLQASSPIEFPPFFGRRNGSQRSKSYRDMYDGEGGLRRASRRSSNRSGRSLSSMSPAASFLARYKSTDGAPLKPTEPDDEGQGIGYHGEYIIGKQIGYGGFSIVKEVTSMNEGTRVVDAVKIVRKQLRDKSEVENEQIQTQFDHEVDIWRYLRHPYILPLLRVYSTEFATFCITKLNKGGTLFDLVRDLRKKKRAGLPPHLAKRYTYQLASAMRYLHNDVQVVHRDIKLENCLLDMTVPNAEVEGGNVLLCDFGMADFVVSDQRDGPDPHSTGTNQNIGPAETSTSIAGSLQYAAPELFSAPGPLFSPAADVWAFGVVVYTLLTARLPFDEGLDAKTAMKIQRGEYDLETVQNAEALQGDGAEHAIELVKGCLDVDPDRRWTVHDVLKCPWFAACAQQLEDVSRPWLAES
ncbi:kinase-like protein [Lentithecium fluviatile CBS 122367]|uniref:Kinase-like protein n=1 Tax=Lentithecium fluviatile CBS 122367 TaxID=1168545 RepID=A0A6G1ICT5_9PLEO|nr:kinase-like protein [Lentithecium fluviatile CBS 122367]